MLQSLTAPGPSRQVKVWDVGAGTPALLAVQDLHVGAVFTASFCADAPALLAAGGARGAVAVWDVTTAAPVAARFGKQLAQGAARQLAAD